jgi:hypothetical protein
VGEREKMMEVGDDNNIRKGCTIKTVRLQLARFGRDCPYVHVTKLSPPLRILTVNSFVVDRTGLRAVRWLALKIKREGKVSDSLFFLLGDGLQ